MSPVSADPANSQPLKTRLAGLVLRLTPDCREVSRLTSGERDHRLPFTTRSRLGLHRIFCKYCARYAQQLELLREAGQRLPEHIEGSGRPALAPEAKARLKRALQERAGRGE